MELMGGRNKIGGKCLPFFFGLSGCVEESERVKSSRKHVSRRRNELPVQRKKNTRVLTQGVNGDE